MILHPPGGRRLARAGVWHPCPTCNAPLGWHYATCATCRTELDKLWLADWHFLLENESIAPVSEEETLLAAVVVEEPELHPWTVVDWAHTLLTCAECGAERGGGATTCVTCEYDFGLLWSWDQEAGRLGTMTMAEHALRVGRWVLRFPHRYSASLYNGWQCSTPLIFAGLPLLSTHMAQELSKRIKKRLVRPEEWVYSDFHAAFESLGKE